MSRKSTNASVDLTLFHNDYPKRKLFFLYTMIFFSNLLINIDHGSIPAATLNLKTDLNIDNV